MGYTHYWRQFAPFTGLEWERIVAESKRICAKAQAGLYAGAETEQSAAKATLEPDEHGFATGFAENGAWRTFPHAELDTPAQGKPVLLAGPLGKGRPSFGRDDIALNGKAPLDYESFILERAPRIRPGIDDGEPRDEVPQAFNFCKTEYRPYDAVVVSILAAAKKIAPDKIKVSSDGGPDAIRYMF